MPNPTPDNPEEAMQRPDSDNPWEQLEREFEERERAWRTADKEDFYAQGMADAFALAARRIRETLESTPKHGGINHGEGGPTATLWICDSTKFVSYVSIISDEEFDYAAETKGCRDCGGPVRKVGYIPASATASSSGFAALLEALEEEIDNEALHIEAEWPSDPDGVSIRLCEIARRIRETREAMERAGRNWCGIPIREDERMPLGVIGVIRSAPSEDEGERAELRAALEADGELQQAIGYAEEIAKGSRGAEVSTRADAVLQYLLSVRDGVLPLLAAPTPSEDEAGRVEHDRNCGIDPLHLGENIGCTCGAEPPDIDEGEQADQLEQERWTIHVWSGCGHRQWGLYEGAEGACPECDTEGEGREVEVVHADRLRAAEEERDRAERERDATGARRLAAEHRAAELGRERDRAREAARAEATTAEIHYRRAEQAEARARTESERQERCPRDSDWCDGDICRRMGICCPKANPPDDRVGFERGGGSWTVSICRLHNAPMFQAQHGCTCERKNTVMAKVESVVPADRLRAVEEERIDCANCDGTGLLGDEEREPCELCAETGKVPAGWRPINHHLGHVIQLWREGKSRLDKVAAAVDPFCPDAAICQSCPAAGEDDVCLPEERLIAEVGMFAAARSTLAHLHPSEGAE